MLSIDWHNRILFAIKFFQKYYIYIQWYGKWCEWERGESEGEREKCAIGMG